jgi:hypothetical protein
MFEITPDDIASLNDEDLRTLVGLLCEAELQRRGQPVSAVMYGGNQAAKDGGIDVRVALAASAEINGFIPRPKTGFQIKKPDMPPSEIEEEMKPKGNLRPAIIELAQSSGAYVIVSGTGATADSALIARRAAMRAALSELPDPETLTIDFFDRTRIASWVREHPSRIPWVRARIGKAIPGWQPFGNWSRAPQGVERSYLTDATGRVHTGRRGDEDGIAVVTAIDRIRNILRKPGASVRLVGLSGTGKTRLAEALFEQAIGAAEPLNPSIAFYTDLADGPTPSPWILIADLVAQRRPGLFVVDNCPADVHRQIADSVRVDDTTVSAITIEYDIRDDQPEGTEVFRLEASSRDLIEALVGRRYPHVSQVDATTIANFAGGNARIALALASTVEKNDSLAGLNDESLFLRLFQQRHQPDDALLSIAEVCALVYSFDGEATAAPNAELQILARLSGTSWEQVFKAVSDLRDRGLVQVRAEWRAVLPPSIANRLAARALRRIHSSMLATQLIDQAPSRLLKSFARRLGYLHLSAEAQAIVQEWLAPGGRLSDVVNLSADDRATFMSVAPVAPDLVLKRLEAAFSNADERLLESNRKFVPLLQSLAYEDSYFERAVSLLIRFVRADAESPVQPSRSSVVEPLFYITLSGTHAALSTRLRVIHGCLISDDPLSRQLGASMLTAALKSDHFSSSATFDFGARSRDHGYHPPTGQAVAEWFSQVLAFATPFALDHDHAVAEPVLEAVGQEFRGLWTNGGQLDALEALARSLKGRRFWRQGWSAARQTLLFDGPGLPQNMKNRLVAVEDQLRPTDLVARVRGFVISPNGTWDVDDLHQESTDDFAAASAKAAAAATALGEATAAEPAALITLLPELVLAKGGRITDFGFGLATAADRPRQLWGEIVRQIAATPPNNVQLLQGFLRALSSRDTELANALLDDALELPSLAKWIPWLQAAVGLGPRGLARLHRAIERGISPAIYFSILSGGRISDEIPGQAFSDLILAIARMPDGDAVALDILGMRLFTYKADQRNLKAEITAVSKTLLGSYRFKPREQLHQGEDNDLDRLVRASLVGRDGAPIARRLVRDLADAVGDHRVSAWDYTELVTALLSTQPHTTLDELFSGDDRQRDSGMRLVRGIRQGRKNAMSSVPDDILVAWCEGDRPARYPIAAAIALVFHRPASDNPEEWTPLARRMLLAAPDPIPVLSAMIQQLRPNGWSGSLASILESRLALLERLDISGLPTLIEAYEAGRENLRRAIASERALEAKEGRGEATTFE